MRVIPGSLTTLLSPGFEPGIIGTNVERSTIRPYYRRNQTTCKRGRAGIYQPQPALYRDKPATTVPIPNITSIKWGYAVFRRRYAGVSRKVIMLLNNPGLLGFNTVDTGINIGSGSAPEMYRNCPGITRIEPVWISFPVTSGCIKHFKTTGAVS